MHHIFIYIYSVLPLCPGLRCLLKLENILQWLSNGHLVNWKLIFDNRASFIFGNPVLCETIIMRITYLAIFLKAIPVSVVVIFFPSITCNNRQIFVRDRWDKAEKLCIREYKSGNLGKILNLDYCVQKSLNTSLVLLS